MVILLQVKLCWTDHWHLILTITARFYVLVRLLLLIQQHLISGQKASTQSVLPRGTLLSYTIYICSLMFTSANMLLSKNTPVMFTGSFAQLKGVAYLRKTQLLWLMMLRMKILNISTSVVLSLIQEGEDSQRYKYNLLAFILMQFLF